MTLLGNPLRIARILLPAAALALSATAAVPGASGRPATSPRAHAAATYMTGIGDEGLKMFASPLWRQLHTRIARYIAPYDAVAHRDSLAEATAWIHAAEEQHEQVLVAFYHSRHTPTRLPTVAQYRHYVQKFLKRFPYVKQYQAWDEANRGNVPYLFSSPSARLNAQYYQALLRLCTKCTVIGLDVLDQANIGPTLQFISEFKSEIGRLRTVMPRIWGLHDYSDVNRLESWRTRAVSRALGGQVWLTETGGIVQFGGAYPNHGGSGLRRAAKVLDYMFALAGSDSQVKRLYVYNWTGGNSRTRFDAGLTDSHNRARMGYVVVCKHLHAARCGVHISSH